MIKAGSEHESWQLHHISHISDTVAALINITTELENKYIIIYYNHITGCLKKRILRRCVIFNPKNVTIGSGIDQNKKLPSF